MKGPPLSHSCHFPQVNASDSKILGEPATLRPFRATGHGLREKCSNFGVVAQTQSPHLLLGIARDTPGRVEEGICLRRNIVCEGYLAESS